jgi:NH3-dependent NAD+ synthetase
MYGVPASTVFATPTDGLGISASDEHQFGFSYLEFDIALLTFMDKYAENPMIRYMNLDTVLNLLDIDSVDTQQRLEKIMGRVRMSTFKRSNPYNLPHPTQNQRYSGLTTLDTALWTK